MIYILIILDVLVYNYTHFKSYFFLVGLINKPYIYYLVGGLFIDFIINDTFFINTIFLTVLYFINRFFKEFNQNSFLIYLINITFNYILLIIFYGIVDYQSIEEILTVIGTNLLINMIIYLLSYNYKTHDIFFSGE